MPPSPYRARPALPRTFVAVLAGALALAVLGGEADAPTAPAPRATARPAVADVAGPQDATIVPASIVTSLGPVVVPPARGPAAPEPAASGATASTTATSTAAPPAPTSSGLPVDATPEQVPDVVTGVLARAYAEIGHVDEDGEHSDAGLVAEREGENPGLLTSIHTADGLAIRVPTPQLRDIPQGATVRVELGGRRGSLGSDPRGDEHAGYEVLNAEVLALPAEEPSSAPSSDVMAAAAPHQVTVVMVAPAGQPKDSTTLATMVSAVETGASGFWSQQTGGAVSFDVVKGVNWITTKATCGSYSSLWSEVATGVGWTSGAGKHLLLYVSSAGSPSSCYSGLGTVGSGPSSGGRAYVRSTSTSIIAHELGHNMGLGHSDGLLCPGVSDGAYSAGWKSGCTVLSTGYRDWYDVMGISWSYLGSLNAPHLVAMGALTSSTGPAVTAPTRAVLRPMSSLSGVRTLQLTDGSTTYWVEFRSASGRDAWLSSNYRGLEAGVTVRRSDPTDANGTLLLDGTPSSTVNSSDWKSPVPVGASMRVGSGRYVIKVESVTSAGAQVAVSVNGTWPDTTPVQVTSPGAGSRVPAGTVTVTGLGTAYEGTLLYEVTDGAGGVVAGGFVNAGSNGALGPFSLAVPLVAGAYTVAVWAPDESDGEGPHGPRPFEVRRSFTVG